MTDIAPPKAYLSPSIAYPAPASAYPASNAAYPAPHPGYPTPDFSYLEPVAPRLAQAALILGIVGLACSWVPFLNIVTGIGSVVGIVLATKVVRRWLPGRVQAVWGIVLGTLALVGTVATAALLVLAFLAIGATQDTAALASMRIDATNYAISAEATQVQSSVYPASVTIAPGTVAAEFPTLPPSDNVISFVNNGDSFVITVTNPAAASRTPLVYESLQSGIVTP